MSDKLVNWDTIILLPTRYSSATASEKVGNTASLALNLNNFTDLQSSTTEMHSSLTNIVDFIMKKDLYKMAGSTEEMIKKLNEAYTSNVDVSDVMIDIAYRCQQSRW